MTSNDLGRTETQAPKAIEIAVIIPTLNERDNVPRIIAALDRVLAGRSFELVFVDDGSKDGTAEELERIALKRRDVRVVRRFGRRGLSSAVVEGFLATAAPSLAVIDADMQHDETILPQLLAHIESGSADLAVATRYSGSGSMGDLDASRVRISGLATRLGRIMVKEPLSDPMSGFFAVRREAFLAALPRLSLIGFKILLDIVASSPTPLRIAEVPYEFRLRTAGESKLDLVVILEYLQLLIDKTLGRWLPLRLILFLLVGACGLVVHLLVLGITYELLGIRFAVAQTAAVGVAIAFNFFLNNAVTYRDRRLKGWAIVPGLLSFYLVCAAGAVANVGVGSLVHSSGGVNWWLSGIAGAVIGAVWNYSASTFLTWRK